MTVANTLLSGAFWFASASVLSKAASFLAQVILGWLLLAEDFGAFAIALSIYALFAGFRNGGTDFLLVQRASKDPDLYGKVTSFSTLFNVVTMVVLVAAGLVASVYYNEASLFWMLALMGVALPLIGLATVTRLKLSILARYKHLSIVTLSSDSARQFSSIVFALAGLGSLSFALPFLVEPIVMFSCAYYFVREKPVFSTLSLGVFKRLLDGCKWLMLSNFAMAMTRSGSYLILSFFIGQALLGVFFFAMQLISSIATPITNSITNILFPHLSGVDDGSRRSNLMARSLVYSVLIGGALSVFVLLGIGPIIHILWAGKWDQAAPIALTLSLLPLSLIVNTLVFSLLSVEGLWKSRFVCIVLAALTDMLATGIGAYSGGLEGAATTLMVSKLTFSVILLVVYMEGFTELNTQHRLMVLSAMMLTCGCLFGIGGLVGGFN